MKNGFGGFINRPDKTKKKPLSLKKCQQKLPKLKCKEKKKKIMEQDIQKLWENYKGIHTCHGNTRRRRKKESN